MTGEYDSLRLDRLWRSRFGVAIASRNAARVCLRRCDACGLGFFDPAPDVGDARFYAQLQRFPWYYRSDKQEYRLAVQAVQPADSVLEVGAGTGALARLLDCSSYVGLEFNEEAAREAVRQGVDVRVQSLEEHAAANAERYDWVCLFQVLEHVPRPREFLANCLKAVRPGGRLLVSVPCQDSFLALETNALLNLPPHHVTRWSGETLRAVADILGLAVEEQQHERLADEHIPSYAAVAAQTGLRRLCRRRHRLVDPLFAAFPVRALVWLLSRAVAAFLAEPDLRPPGHSITTVYRKSPPASQRIR